MAQPHIKIFSFAPIDEALLMKVSASVTKEFRLPVVIRQGRIDLSDYFDPSRRQYNGNELLKLIENQFIDDAIKTFGLFNVDLFIPILTYIFGQAFLGGKTAIASVYRLSNERYGLKEDKNLLISRTMKEVNHELGHTFGLIHCRIPGCVMASSTYVEDIDQKKTYLCNRCREEMERGENQAG